LTIAATATWNPTVDSIIKQSAQLAGILSLGRPVDPKQLGDMREMLQAVLKELSARGVGLDQAELTSFTLPAATGQATPYALPADTVDVDFPMMLKAAGETTETPATRYSWQEYQELPNKSTTGRPIKFYVNPQTMTLTPWPVPDVDYTVSYKRTRLIRDATSGSTVDLRPRWTLALVYTLAHMFAVASSLGVERVKYLAGMAKEKTDEARGREHESGGAQFVLETEW
jgi:hypothetical protein